MNRVDLAIKFKEEYEQLCNKYEMEIDMYDTWDTDILELVIYDREQKLFIIDVL